MENSGTAIPSENPMVITAEIKSFLKEVSKWSRFLAIIGYISLGLILLAALMLFLAGSTRSEYSRTEFKYLAFGYLFIAVLYYFPVNYLYKSGAYLKHALAENRQDLLAKGFENLKSHYKFIGITTIVILSIYVLLFIGALL